MTANPYQLAAELAPLLERYRPVIKPVGSSPLDKHRRRVRESMQRLRDRRRAAGLNASGQPRKPNLGRPKKNAASRVQ